MTMKMKTTAGMLMLVAGSMILASTASAQVWNPMGGFGGMTPQQQKQMQDQQKQMRETQNKNRR